MYNKEMCVSFPFYIYRVQALLEKLKAWLKWIRLLNSRQTCNKFIAVKYQPINVLANYNCHCRFPIKLDAVQ